MKNIWKNFKTFFNSERGSFMIEAAVGLSLITIGMLGILTLVSRSMKINHTVEYKVVAANLAAEGVEVVRNLIDINCAQEKAWNDGLSDGIYKVSFETTGDLSDSDWNTPIKYSSSTGEYGYDLGDDTIYKRKIGIFNKSGYEIVASSTVEWIFEKKTKKVSIEDHFFNWRGDNL